MPSSQVAKHRRAPPALAVSATENGAPIELRSAIAFRYRHSRTIEVRLSTDALSCHDAGMFGRAPRGGERLFQLVIAPKIEPDGKARWALVGKNAGITHSTVPIEVDNPSVAKSAPVTFRIGGQLSQSGLSLSGTLEARSCGELEFMGEEEGKAIGKDITVSVAGESIEIHGAVYYPDKSAVVLGSDPLTCYHGLASVLDVGIALPIREGTSAMAGSRVGTIYPQDNRRDRPIEIEPWGDLVQLTIHRELDIGGYPVKVDGKVRTFVCGGEASRRVLPPAKR